MLCTGCNLHFFSFSPACVCSRYLPVLWLPPFACWLNCFLLILRSDLPFLRLGGCLMLLKLTSDSWVDLIFLPLLDKYLSYRCTRPCPLMGTVGITQGFLCVRQALIELLSPLSLWDFCFYWCWVHCLFIRLSLSFNAELIVLMTFLSLLKDL